MRANIFTQFFPPEGTPGARRVLALAEALQHHCGVVVITLKPSYPSPESFSASDTRSLNFSFPVHRGFHFHPHRGGMVVRALRELWMSRRLGRLRSGVSPDVILATSPSMFLGPATLSLARRALARFVWDIRDVTWQYAAEHEGGRAKRWVADLLKRWMIHTAQAADLVSCANPGIARILHGQGVLLDKTIVVPNGVTPEFLASFSDDAFPPANGQPVVSYIGVLGLNQGLRTFVEAAGLVPEARFVLVGDGAEREQLEALSRRRGLRNVVFTGFVKGVPLLHSYRNSDILFAQLRDRPTLANGAWPSKLFEYMAACRPIVYAGKGQAAQAVSQVEAGIVVRPEDPLAVAQAIRELLASPQRREVLARNGRRHVMEHCHRDKIMQEFAAEVCQRFSR